MDEELEMDPAEEEEFLAAWAEADRQAGEVLELACPDVLDEVMPAEMTQAAAQLRAGVERGGWPYDYFRNACGWQGGAPAEDDFELWLLAVASTIAPESDPRIDVEEMAALDALQHADWLALVVGLVRRGVGARLDAESWFADLSRLPEIDGEAPEDLQEFYEPVVETIVPLWQAIGALDDDRRLSVAGRWGLPQALLVVWGEADGGGLPRLTEEEGAIALDILAERSMTLEQLRVELARRGVFADVERLGVSLGWREDVYGFEDGVWAFLPPLLEGVVLTHRLTAEELALEVLDPDLDLVLWDFLALDGVAFADGGELSSHHGRERRLPVGARSGLAGPPGWLSGFDAGDLVGVRYVAGALTLEHVQPIENPRWRDLMVSLAWRLAEAAADPERADAQDQEDEYPAVHSLELAMTLLRDHPGALAGAQAPWSELLADSGLEIHRGHLGVPGTGWRAEPDWLEEDDRAAYRAWRDLLSLDRLGQIPPKEELAAVAAGLRGVIVDLAATDLVEERDREPLVVKMLRASSGAACAAPLYLRARAAEAAGDCLAMRDLLEAAIAADPAHEDALADLADLRAVAGDAREAARLYALAELDPQAPEVHALRLFLDPPAGGPGRNKPCPCGSGKKYKVCHGRTDRHPLVDRGGWLLVKLKAFLQRSVNRENLYGWALLGREATEDNDVVMRAMNDALAWDLAVFDGGVLEAFQQLYGPLLPDDEAELLEQWATSTRRLLEVTAVKETLGITCRDVLAGDEFDVPDRALSQELGPDHLLYGRLLDQGDGRPRFWDYPIGVPDSLRARFTELLRSDPAPADLARFITEADGA